MKAGAALLDRVEDGSLEAALCAAVYGPEWHVLDEKAPWDHDDEKFHIEG
jgi:hypothetical protein